MPSYTVKEVNLGSLTRCHSAFYQELCIINACTENIVVIDIEGNQNVIEPVGSTFTNQTVQLHRRSTMKNSMNMNGTSLPLAGITVEVPFYHLQAGPIYVEEFNVMLCRESDAATCRHPHMGIGYIESLHNGLEMICDKICDAPGIRLMANDPNGRYEELYTLINSQVITIPVTNLDDDEFTLTIIIINNGQYYAETASLSEITEGKTNIVEFSSNMIPFVTTSKANAETMAKSFKWLTPKTFAEYKDKVEKQHQEELSAKDDQFAALKSEKDAKLKELGSKLTLANTNIDQLKAERDDYKAKYQCLKTDIEATSDMMSAYRDKNKYATDLEMAKNDMAMSTMKLQHQKEEATYKTWHVVLAAVVPAITAILIELFRSK